MHILKEKMILNLINLVNPKNPDELTLKGLNPFRFKLTLERRLFATPGAPGAGQSGHFRLSTWILRDTEVIATNDFFQKEGAPFSDR